MGKAGEKGLTRNLTPSIQWHRIPMKAHKHPQPYHNLTTAQKNTKHCTPYLSVPPKNTQMHYLTGRNGRTMTGLCLWSSVEPEETNQGEKTRRNLSQTHQTKQSCHVTVLEETRSVRLLTTETQPQMDSACCSCPFNMEKI